MHARFCLTGEQLCSTSVCPSVLLSGAGRELMLLREVALDLKQLPDSGDWSAGTRKVGLEEEHASLSIQNPAPSPPPWPSRCPPPFLTGSPNSACQALQITTHANKSLETRTANAGLPWRPIPGASSPGRAVAQVCCGESWEGPHAWQRGDKVLCSQGADSGPWPPPPPLAWPCTPAES